jgi:hypothetical protein
MLARPLQFLLPSAPVEIALYIYIYIYRERERERVQYIYIYATSIYPKILSSFMLIIRLVCNIFTTFILTYYISDNIKGKSPETKRTVE